MYHVRKGTATLFRTDRRRAVIPSVAPSLIVEVSLSLASETLIPSPLVASAFLYLPTVAASLFDEKSFAESRLSVGVPWESSISPQRLINILSKHKTLAINKYYSSINYLGAASLEAAGHWRCIFDLSFEYQDILYFEKSFSLLLLAYFSGEIPGKNIYSALLGCNPFIEKQVSAEPSIFSFILPSVSISKESSFCILLSDLATSVIDLSLFSGVPVAFSSSLFHVISNKYFLRLNLFIEEAFIFNLLWHRDLIFKTLAEIGGLRSLIGLVLVELSSPTEFRSISEFTTEILTVLTSSVPLPEPAIPHGKIFITDITQIYKYLIDLES